MRILPPQSIDIRYVAKLARIALTDEEIETFGEQLGDLLGHVNALEKLDIASVPVHVGTPQQWLELRHRGRALEVERQALLAAVERLSDFAGDRHVRAQEGAIGFAGI